MSDFNKHTTAHGVADHEVCRECTC